MSDYKTTTPPTPEQPAEAAETDKLVAKLTIVAVKIESPEPVNDNKPPVNDSNSVFGPQPANDNEPVAVPSMPAAANDNFPVEAPLVAALDHWVATKLPPLNAQMEVIGGLPSPMLLDLQSVFVTGDVSNAITQGAFADPAVAAEMLNLIGMAVSALERWFQANGDKPGAGVAALAGVEDVLEALQTLSGSPKPRNTHYGYFLNNAKERTFTGEDPEKFFGRAVRHDNHELTAARDLLHPIRSGEVSLDDVEAVELLKRALHRVQSVIFFNARYKQVMPDGFFAKKMRPYLCAWPVRTVSHTGPNATFVAANARLDLAIGMRNDLFLTTVRERREHMNVIDRGLIAEELVTPSLEDVVATHLKLPKAQAKFLHVDAIAEAVVEAGPRALKTLDAISDLAKTSARLYSGHKGLIKRHLIDATVVIEEAAKKRLLVGTNDGVSGRDLSHTYELEETRRTHWLATSLGEAVRKVGAGST